MRTIAGTNNEFVVTGASQDESFITTSQEPLRTKINIENEAGEILGSVYFSDKKSEEDLTKEVNHVANNVYKFIEQCQS